MSFQDFVPYRHETFRVVEAEGYELKLVDLIDHSNAVLEQFSLTFVCSVLPWLPQRTYTLVHANRIEISLFIVPIGPFDGAMRYESVFSQFANGSRTTQETQTGDDV